MSAYCSREAVSQSPAGEAWWTITPTPPLSMWMKGWIDGMASEMLAMSVEPARCLSSAVTSTFTERPRDEAAAA